MAVAVKDTPETAGRRLLDPLPLGSLVGALYILACLGVLFYGLPNLWSIAIASWLVPALGKFFNEGLLMMSQVAAGVGLIILGLRLMGSQPPHGMRAGIFACLVGVLAIGFLTWAVGSLLETYWLRSESERMIGIVLTSVVGVALLVGAGWLLINPNNAKYLIQLEDQGWFSRAIYKRNQGLRVRRGTILGILAVAGSGIWVLLNHQTLDAVGVRSGDEWINNWVLLLPFANGASITVLPQVRFTVPILLALGTLWLSFRIVNFPLFTDFLIATEAELNKVSWTTRKRLVQDTIVVLTTVVLLTIFLFVVDIAWGWILSQKYVGVLRIDEGKIQKEVDTKEQPW